MMQNFHEEFYMYVYLCIMIPVNWYFPVRFSDCGCRLGNLCLAAEIITIYSNGTIDLARYSRLFIAVGDVLRLEPCLLLSRPHAPRGGGGKGQ